MSVYELAGRLSRAVRVKRLERIGEPLPPAEADPLAKLPEDERQPWLDVAEVVQEMLGYRVETVLRLHGLADDWERYTQVLAQDPEWRDQMRRAVVIEMRSVIDRLWKECQ